MYVIHDIHILWLSVHAAVTDCLSSDPRSHACTARRHPRVVTASRTSEGDRFHAEVARYVKNRRANSLRIRGGCSKPVRAPRVSRTVTSLRYTIVSRNASGARRWCMARNIMATSRSVIRSSKVGQLTRALLGLWIFHRLLGGGGVWTPPPPMISAPGRRREKRKAAFESSRKIISKSFRSFLAQVKIGVSRGPNSKIFQNGISTIKSLIFNPRPAGGQILPPPPSRIFTIT